MKQFTMLPSYASLPISMQAGAWFLLSSPCRAGAVGMGHVRYPTAGTASVQEAQPFFVNSPLGMYLIHNGNITNTAELKVLLNSSSSFFNRYLRTDSDSEVSQYLWSCCTCILLKRQLVSSMLTKICVSLVLVFSMCYKAIFRQRASVQPLTCTYVSRQLVFYSNFV